MKDFTHNNCYTLEGQDPLFFAIYQGIYSRGGGLSPVNMRWFKLPTEKGLIEKLLPIEGDEFQWIDLGSAEVYLKKMSDKHFGDGKDGEV